MEHDTVNVNVDLKIDKDNLELEWEKQSHLYYFYAEQSANAIEAQQIAKEEVEVLEAQLDRDIRNDPESYDIMDKLTEKKVMSAIWGEEDYKNTKTKAIECTKTVNVLKGILTAFDHKKSALESLTRLFLSNYYAEPIIPEKTKSRITEQKDMGEESKAFKD